MCEILPVRLIVRETKENPDVLVNVPNSTSKVRQRPREKLSSVWGIALLFIVPHINFQSWSCTLLLIVPNEILLQVSIAMYSLILILQTPLTFSCGAYAVFMICVIFLVPQNKATWVCLYVFTAQSRVKWLAWVNGIYTSSCWISPIWTIYFPKPYLKLLITKIKH